MNSMAQQPFYGTSTFLVLRRAQVNVGIGWLNWWAVYPPNCLYNFLFLISKCPPPNHEAPTEAPANRWMYLHISGLWITGRVETDDLEPIPSNSRPVRP
jgi:hypothetical protein